MNFISENENERKHKIFAVKKRALTIAFWGLSPTRMFHTFTKRRVQGCSQQPVSSCPALEAVGCPSELGGPVGRGEPHAGHSTARTSCVQPHPGVDGSWLGAQRSERNKTQNSTFRAMPFLQGSETRPPTCAVGSQDGGHLSGVSDWMEAEGGLLGWWSCSFS